jgi:hypothetical protein
VNSTACNRPVTSSPQQSGCGSDERDRKIAKRKLTLLVILFGLILYLIDLAFASGVSGIQIGGIGVVAIVLLDAWGGLARHMWKEFLVLFAGTALALGAFIISTAAHPDIWWLGVGGTLLAAAGAVRLALFVIDSKSDELVATRARGFPRRQ